MLKILNDFACSRFALAIAMLGLIYLAICAIDGINHDSKAEGRNVNR